MLSYRFCLSARQNPNHLRTSTVVTNAVGESRTLTLVLSTTVVVSFCCFCTKRIHGQGELEKVLSQRFNRLVRVVAAGRTDGGVHARCHAIHFDLFSKELKEKKKKSGGGDDSNQDNDNNKNSAAIPVLERSVRKMLPDDITFWDLREMDPITKVIDGINNNEPVTVPYNVMYDTIGKLYVYRIAIGTDSLDPILRHDRWQLPRSAVPDLGLFRQCLQRYEGDHDFRAFASGIESLERGLAAAGRGDSLNTVRTVFRAELVEEEPGRMYRIEVHLKGALYKMVRNMVGTALAVATHKLSMQDFEALLRNDDDSTSDSDDQDNNLERQKNPCRPAPAFGLTLEKVYFADDSD